MGLLRGTCMVVIQDKGRSLGLEMAVCGLVQKGGWNMCEFQKGLKIHTELLFSGWGHTKRSDGVDLLSRQLFLIQACLTIRPRGLNKKTSGNKILNSSVLSLSSNIDVQLLRPV